MRVLLLGSIHRTQSTVQPSLFIPPHLMTCMKLLASSIPGRESAKSVSSSFARPLSPAARVRHTRFIVQLIYSTVESDQINRIPRLVFLLGLSPKSSFGISSASKTVGSISCQHASVCVCACVREGAPEITYTHHGIEITYTHHGIEIVEAFNLSRIFGKLLIKCVGYIVGGVSGDEENAVSLLGQQDSKATAV